MMAELLTVDDAAKILRLRPATVRRMARDGRLPAVRLARGWRFLEDDLRRWLEQNRWTTDTPTTGRK